MEPQPCKDGSECSALYAPISNDARRHQLIAKTSKPV
jgi:hypothetical protein